MFDALADRLEDAWKKLRGQDKISSANIDVNLQVVKGVKANPTVITRGSAPIAAKSDKLAAAARQPTSSGEVVRSLKWRLFT